MKVFLFIAISLFLPVHSNAQEKQEPTKKEWKTETLTIDGETYQEITVRLRNPAVASVSHKYGGTSIHPSKLPQEAQIAIGYNADSSKEFEERTTKAAIRAQNIKSLANGAFSIEIEVISIIDSGILGTARIYDDTGKYTKSESIFFETPTSGLGILTGKTYEFAARKVGTFTYTTVVGSEKTVEKYKNLEVIIQELDQASK